MSKSGEGHGLNFRRAFYIYKSNGETKFLSSLVNGSSFFFLAYNKICIVNGNQFRMGHFRTAQRAFWLLIATLGHTIPGGIQYVQLLDDGFPAFRNLISIRKDVIICRRYVYTIYEISR